MASSTAITPKSTTTNIEQERLSYVWKKLDEIHKQNIDRYKVAAKSAPAIVMSNGLMAALLFYVKDRQSERSMLANHVSEWILKKVFRDTRNYDDRATDALLEKLSESTHLDHLRLDASTAMMRATDEALELLKWFRLASDARAT